MQLSEKQLIIKFAITLQSIDNVTFIVSNDGFGLKQNGVNADWREIVRIMNTQKCVTTSVVNINQQIISVRQCTEPTKGARAIYDILKYKYVPFLRKKSVVTPAEIGISYSP
jgi:hypothetical protein